MASRQRRSLRSEGQVWEVFGISELWRSITFLLTDIPLKKKFAARLAWPLSAILLRATFQRYKYFSNLNFQVLLDKYKYWFRILNFKMNLALLFFSLQFNFWEVEFLTCYQLKAFSSAKIWVAPKRHRWVYRLKKVFL